MIEMYVDEQRRIEERDAMCKPEKLSWVQCAHDRLEKRLLKLNDIRVLLDKAEAAARAQASAEAGDKAYCPDDFNRPVKSSMMILDSFKDIDAQIDQNRMARSKTSRYSKAKSASIRQLIADKESLAGRMLKFLGWDGKTELAKELTFKQTVSVLNAIDSIKKLNAELLPLKWKIEYEHDKKSHTLEVRFISLGVPGEGVKYFTPGTFFGRSQRANAGKVKHEAFMKAVEEL